MANLLKKSALLSPKTTALLLCDMQVKFRPTVKYFDQIVLTSNRILKTAMSLEMPVIVTEQYPKGLGPIVPELGIQEYNLKPYAKTQFCMLVPDVVNVLQQQSHIKSIILCGIETHACIQQTALDLLERSYNVHIIVDACSSRSLVDRKYAFKHLRSCGAYLTTSESVILSLVRDAAHPKFKEVQRYIQESAPDTSL